MLALDVLQENGEEWFMSVRMSICNSLGGWRQKSSLLADCLSASRCTWSHAEAASSPEKQTRETTPQIHLISKIE